MKYLLNLLLFCFLIACNSKVEPKGEIEIKDFPLKKMNELYLNGHFKVFVKESNKNSIVVETYPNVIDNLIIENENNRLSITEKNDISPVDFYQITLYTHLDIQKLEMGNIAELTIEDSVKSNHLLIKLKDNSKLMASLHNQSTELSMSQKTRLNINGISNNGKINIKDSASIIAPTWQINHLELDAKNQTNIEVLVNKILNGTLSNSSQLFYYGTPQKNIQKKDKATITKK